MAAKALIVDFGGVLTTSVWDSFAGFCVDKHLDEGAVRRLFKTDPEALAELRLLETGSISEADFEERFAERLGLEEAQDLIASMFRGMLPEPQMVEAVRSVRQSGIKTGLLSNSWSTSHYDRELLGELFDDVVISAEVHLHKPDPAIFELACKRLAIEPGESIFVDDLRENIEGAQAVGMVGLLHREPAATIAKLEELLAVPLGASGGQ
jgi:epoxide hydrolase-like predicted phosphatase